MDQRLQDVVRLYSLLDRLEARIGGRRALSSSDSRARLPHRGVYFFMEPRELRMHSGSGMRIVRVGTHALKPGSKATLAARLAAHKGSVASGGGNHRGSIFRLLIGTTLPEARAAGSTWGDGPTAPAEIRRREAALEGAVSSIIREMPFVYLGVDDEPSRDSARGLIERNSIALLSNYRKAHIDPPSMEWRGRLCDREKVRASGLWNNQHVDEAYDPSFLDAMEALVERASA